MPIDPELNFYCGEYPPGKKPNGDKRFPPQVPDVEEPDPNPPYKPDKKWPPNRPKPPYWICICLNECPGGYEMGGGGKLCENENSRKCVRSNDPLVAILAPLGLVGVDVHLTKGDCEKNSFKKAPCLLCGWECKEHFIPCPPGYLSYYPVAPGEGQSDIQRIDRHCQECEPFAHNADRPECNSTSELDCWDGFPPFIPPCDSEWWGCYKDPYGNPQQPSPGQPGPATPVGYRCESQLQLCDPKKFPGPPYTYQVKVKCVKCTLAWKKANPTKTCPFSTPEQCKSHIPPCRPWTPGGHTRTDTGPCEGMCCPTSAGHPSTPGPTGPYTGGRPRTPTGPTTPSSFHQ